MGQALEYTFCVTARDPDVIEVVDWIFAGLFGPALPGPVDDYVIEPDADHEGATQLRRDETVLLRRSSLASVLDLLVWHVNHEAVGRTTGLVLFHASAVEHDGVVVVFPGESGAGKTTLAAALTQHGFRYVTDEAVALDPATLLIHPYPKPLSIRPASLGLLPGFAPPQHGRFAEAFGRDLHASPVACGGGISRGGVPGVLVAATFGSGLGDEVRSASRSEMLHRLVTASFEGATPPHARASHVRALRDVVRGATCLEMAYADLGAALDIVTDAVERRRELEEKNEQQRVGGGVPG